MQETVRWSIFLLTFAFCVIVFSLFFEQQLASYFSSKKEALLTQGPRVRPYPLVDYDLFFPFGVVAQQQHLVLQDREREELQYRIQSVRKKYSSLFIYHERTFQPVGVAIEGRFSWRGHSIVVGVLVNPKLQVVSCSTKQRVWLREGAFWAKDRVDRVLTSLQGVPLEEWKVRVPQTPYPSRREFWHRLLKSVYSLAWHAAYGFVHWTNRYQREAQRLAQLFQESSKSSPWQRAYTLSLEYGKKRWWGILGRLLATIQPLEWNILAVHGVLYSPNAPYPLQKKAGEVLQRMLQDPILASSSEVKKQLQQLLQRLRVQYEHLPKTEIPTWLIPLLRKPSPLRPSKKGAK